MNERGLGIFFGNYASAAGTPSTHPRNPKLIPSAVESRDECVTCETYFHSGRAMKTYRIILQPEPEGGFTVTVPSLPGCITYGETLEEAKLMAQEAIEGYLEVLQELGEEIPDDSKTLEYSLTLAA